MSSESAGDNPPLNPHFFRRERDGSVRVRIRFSPEEAALIEEAAGETPLMLYIHRVLNESSGYYVKKARARREEGEDPHEQHDGRDNRRRNSG